MHYPVHISRSLTHCTYLTYAVEEASLIDQETNVALLYNFLSCQPPTCPHLVTWIEPWAVIHEEFPFRK
jgi:hypothetical protein